jgi:hypothetical protein
LQTARAATDAIDGKFARAAGFSLHAGVACEVHEREKLERLCRYITRPAVSTERLSLTTQGNIRYRLKTPYRNGTTDVVFEPLDCMARLAPWCRRRASTSRAITAFLHPITGCR